MSLHDATAASRINSEANITAAAAGAAWAAVSQSGARSIGAAVGAASGVAAVGVGSGNVQGSSGAVHSNSGGSRSTSEIHSNSGGVRSHPHGSTPLIATSGSAQSHQAAGTGTALVKQPLERQLSR